MRAFAAVLLALSTAGQDVTPKNFDKLYATIKPHGDEVWWSQIPWTLDGPEARKRAAAEGKPILVWTMSGMPLGSS